MTDNYPSEGERAIAADEATAASAVEPTLTQLLREAQAMRRTQLLREAQAMRRQADEIEAAAARAIRAAELARLPKMPDCSDGPRYVTFTKYQSGREYHFAAVGWQIGGMGRSMARTYWAITGTNTQRHNWSSLLQFVGEENWSTIHALDLGKRIGRVTMAKGYSPGGVNYDRW